MRIMRIKWSTGEHDLEMEEWLKNVLPDMSPCEIIDVEEYEWQRINALTVIM